MTRAGRAPEAAWLIGLACLLGLCVATPPARAAADRYALVEAGRDSDGTTDVYLEGTLPLAPARALTLGAGATRASARDSANATLLLARYAHGTDRPAYPDVGYQYWGEHGAFTTHTVSVAGNWRGDRGTLRMAPQARRIIIDTQPGVLPRRTLASSSVGLEGSGTLYLGRHGDVTGAATAHAYADDPSRLATPRARAILSRGGLALASGLLDRYLMAGGGITLGNLRLGLERSFSVYAADGSHADGSALRLELWALPGGLDLGLTLGRVSDDTGTVRYARALAGHGW